LDITLVMFYEWFPVFLRIFVLSSRVKQSKKSPWSWRLRHHDPSKYQEPLTQWHSVTSLKISFLRNTLMRNWRPITVFTFVCCREEMSQLFVSVRGPGVSSALGGSVVGIEGTQSLRRASSIRRTFTTGTAGIKRKSVCLQVKFTVVSVNTV